MKTLFLFLLLITSRFIPASAQKGNIKQLDKDRGFNDAKLGMDFNEITGIEYLGRWDTPENEIPFWRTDRDDEKLEFRNIKLRQVYYGFINTKLSNIKVWLEPTDFSELLSILTNLY